MDERQRPGLARLIATLERPPGSLREEARLRELGDSFVSLMYAVSRISAAFEVQLPQDRLLLIKTVGELLRDAAANGGEPARSGSLKLERGRAVRETVLHV